MHRRTWTSTLKQLEVGFQNGSYPPTFAKPAVRHKRFTGCVFESEYDFYSVYGVSRQEKLLCSEVVSWVSEYRVYVVRSQIRSIDYYDGNANVLLDIEKVQYAIQGERI